MKKKVLIVLISACVLGFAFSSCSSDDAEGGKVVDMMPQTRSIQLTQDQKELARKNNDFTFDLYRAINGVDEGKKSNITSPLSVTYVLGMLNDGAAGKTAEEIANVLGFGTGNRYTINAFCQALIQQAPLADPSVTLQISNVVATDEKVDLEDSYRRDMNDFYDAEVASLDFASPASLDYLNSWSNEKSDGMIPKIIDKLSPETKLVLMNAIFFKATWTSKFDEKDTKDEAFTRADSTTINIPMMHRNALIMYGENELFSSVCLPYGSGDKYRMYVLLPSEGKTVDDIVEVLTNEYWEQNKPCVSAVVDLKLPRFTTSSDILLNDIISQLGAPSMFDKNKADFSGISKNYKELCVSLMKQQAAIEVTEEGTKTSVVTIARGLESAVGPVKKDPLFHANRPFVYLIQEFETNVIFFIGAFQGN